MSTTPQILCIDNDSGTSDWIKIKLRAENIMCSVTSVTTGLEAFNVLNQKDFDLCILDYALPDMTGVQLCALMRRMGSDVPMLFFTAMNRQIDREMAKNSGADEYLCKPDDLEIFADAVSHLLKCSRPHYVSNSLEFAPYARAA